MAYYLDLFKANPLTEPDSSVLSAITGSATRPEVTDDLVVAQPLPFRKRQLVNPDVISIDAASDAVSNVSYVALFDAATDGTLLTFASVGTYPRTIGKDNPVQFDAMQLAFVYRNIVMGTTFHVTVDLSGTVTIVHNDVPAGVLMWGDGNYLMWGDGNFLLWT